MQTILTVNLTDKTVLEGGSGWTPPTVTYGESMTIGLLLQETVNGNAIASPISPTGVTAAIGNIDARPTSGQYALQVGPGAQTDANTTTSLAYNASPADVQSAINALAGVTAAYGACTARFVNGSWLLRFAGSVQPPVTCVNNTLIPISYGRISATVLDGEWEVELRLTQLPVAFSDTGEAILPPAPAVAEIIEGGSSGGETWNEVQSLYVRPDFAGTYAIQIGGTGQTMLLSALDTAASVQAALVAAYGPNFTVAVTKQWTVYITYTGIYAGLAMPLAAIILQNPPAGALTFTLQLTRYELLSLFRTTPVVELPLQVQLTYLDANSVLQTEVVITQLLSIQLGNIFPDMASVPSQDWLRAPSPKTYVPFSSGTVIVGQQYFTAIIGDGSATSFDVAHGLGTDIVFAWVRLAVTPGAQLVEGHDYSVEINDANSVTIAALLITPAAGAWMVIVASAQTVGAFADGLTIDIGQVTGLTEALATLSSAVAALTALGITNSIVATAIGGNAQAIVIPDLYLIFPNKRLGASFQASTLDSAAPNSAVVLGLARAPALLPAINTATVTAFDTGVLPPSPGADTVWQNTGGAAIFIPGARGLASSSLPVSGLLGFDGRMFYLLTEGSGPNTYFPTAFEQILCPPVTFDSALWQPGQAFTLTFNLSVQTFKATSNCQWNLVIEIGTAPSDTSPATTTENLQDVVWGATPLLTQRLVVTPLEQTWQFGAQILRSSSNVMTALQLKQATWSAADAAPAAPSFVLRARLVNFDTQDPITAAVGYVWAHFAGASATIQ
jgi:hypothetical protein